MNLNVWNFWAGKYHRLWVQKYSLRPTRSYIVSTVPESLNIEDNIKLLDLGCGPGELISELKSRFGKINITGIDFSPRMLEISKEKNPEAIHINMDAGDLHSLEGKYRVIVCTHSLPYYKEPERVIGELNRILEEDGRIYMGFASGDSLYDKLVLSIVKLTTGWASYPSDKRFRQMTEPYFQVENLKIIREKFFMPRIAVYTLKKVRK